MQHLLLNQTPGFTMIPCFPVYRSSRRSSFSPRAFLSSPPPPSVSGASSPKGGSPAILHVVGLSKYKPPNCISSVSYEGNKCNMHLLGLSKDVREGDGVREAGDGVREAGMVDVRFNTVGVSDVFSMGTRGMCHSLQSRDLIADSIETEMTAQCTCYDGNISIPGCDKNMPGTTMAMGRLNQSSIMVCGETIKDVDFLTDGRFSGASHGFVAGHICPEAQGVKGYCRNIDDSITDATIAQMEASFYGLQIIPNDDLEEMKELGSGAFGTVCHGKWRGTDVAVKRIKKSCFQDNSSVQERLKKDVWGEAQMLSALRHPNVVAFYGVVLDGPEGTLAIVTEFMADGSLGNVLSKKDRLLDRQKSIKIAMDAAFGMEYLHSKKVIHFDIKCDNLLVNLRDPERPICKVGDLGLSKIKHNTLVSGGGRGTLLWMAPELRYSPRSSRVSEKVDVYSFGIAMWEIQTGEKPYANMLYGADKGGVCGPEWKKLMEDCCSHDPAARPSFTEIKNRLRDMM